MDQEKLKALSYLLEQGLQVLAQKDAPEQTVLLLTEKGSLCTLIMEERPVYRELDTFLETRKGEADTRILYLLCLWRDGSLDVPSAELRKALLALNPGNSRARVLLNGGDGLNLKPLSVMM